MQNPQFDLSGKRLMVELLSTTRQLWSRCTPLGCQSCRALVYDWDSILVNNMCADNLAPKCTRPSKTHLIWLVSKLNMFATLFHYQWFSTIYVDQAAPFQNVGSNPTKHVCPFSVKTNTSPKKPVKRKQRMHSNWIATSLSIHLYICVCVCVWCCNIWCRDQDTKSLLFLAMENLLKYV